MKHRRWQIAVVGPGSVGQVLGKALLRRGDRICAIVSRTDASARAAGRFLECRNVGTDLHRVPATTDLVLLTVPHEAIEVTAGALAAVPHLQFKRLRVCHASGMFGAPVLAALAGKGACVFAFHPLQTFPRTFAPKALLPTLPGIWYGIDGDARGQRAAKELAKRLGGKTIVIPPALRAYYHAAGVVASNHLTALLAVLEEMHRAMGITTTDVMPLFSPIIAATLKNVSATSPAEALSGPVVRGGTETLARHFESIAQRSPQLLPYFSMMTMETVRLAQRRGALNDDQVRAFFEIIRSQLAGEKEPTQ